MRDLRKFFCWLFAISSLLCFWNALKVLVYLMHRHYALFSIRDLLPAAFFPLLVFIFTIAWWTVWKEKRSGRVWATVASGTYILISLWMLIYLQLPFWHQPHPEVMLAIGVIGLVTYLWPYKEISGKTGETN